MPASAWHCSTQSASPQLAKISACNFLLRELSGVEVPGSYYPPDISPQRLPEGNPSINTLISSLLGRDTSEEHSTSCTREWTPIAHKGNLLINTLHINFLFFLKFLPLLLVLQGSLTKSMACIQSVSQHLLLWESTLGQCNKCFIKQWVTLRQCLIGIMQPSDQRMASIVKLIFR